MRQAVAGRVRNVDDIRAGCDHRLDHTGEEFEIGSSGVFCKELDFYAFALSVLHSPNTLFKYFLACGVELVLDVNVGSSQAGVDTSAPGILQRFCCYVDIIFLGAGERAYSGFDGFGDFDYRKEIARTRDREPSLDDVNTQPLQGFRYDDLFVS